MESPRPPSAKTVTELLTVEEMAWADRLTIAAGVAGETLMENAGRAVAHFILNRWDRRPTLVLCGPGNNGGDGFVVARHLRVEGWPVRVAFLGDLSALPAAAAHHAALWADVSDGPIEDLSGAAIGDAGLIVDGLFGAGLSRPLDGLAAEFVETINASGLPVVAVDIPSGISGNSGQALAGRAIEATATVTFFRPKPGHFLLPGRSFTGKLEVADIGIDTSVLAEIAPACFLNGPPVWLASLPLRTAESHKYRHGHLLIPAGETMTGAARLAARGAQRVGAGLVTLAGRRESLPMLALAGPSVILSALDDQDGWRTLLADPRINAVLLGPGLGRGEPTVQWVRDVLSSCEEGRSLVLDADALTSFAGAVSDLCEIVSGSVVMTPHEGEFARLFPDLTGERLGRARRAAELSGAVVLLKGHDSVVAAPDGRAVINANAPPWLATAGSGDVLAGMVAGLLGQGMPPFEAAACACWLHGACGSAFGIGLIAEDIPEMLPRVLQNLWNG